MPIEIKDFFDHLEKIGEKEKENTDYYLNEMKEFLKQQPQWGPKHDEFFAILKKRIKITQLKWIISLVALVIITAIVGSYQVIQNTRQSVIADLLQSNMSLCFQKSANGNSELLAKYSDNQGSEKAKELLTKYGLQGKILGRYSGLGEEVHLRIMPYNGATQWKITANSLRDICLGSVLPSHGFGEVDRQEINLNEIIFHDGETEELGIKLIKVPQRWNDRDINQTCEYEVHYFLNNQNGDILKQFTFRSSPDGNKLRGPYVIYHPTQSAVYIVYVAAGLWGKDKNQTIPTIYNFKSKAEKIYFR